MPPSTAERRRQMPPASQTRRAAACLAQVQREQPARRKVKEKGDRHGLSLSRCGVFRVSYAELLMARMGPVWLSVGERNTQYAPTSYFLIATAPAASQSTLTRIARGAPAA